MSECALCGCPDAGHHEPLRAALAAAELERDHYRGASELLVGAEERAQAAEADRNRLQETLRRLENDGDDYAAGVARAALAGAPAKEEP